MSSSWQEVQIGSLGRVITGKTPSTSKLEYWGDTYPFITPTDIQGDSAYITTERFLSEVGAQKLRTSSLPLGTICFVCIGATIGKICRTSAPISFSNQQINSVVVDSRSHDSWFVFYLLKHNAETVKSIASGAATPIVNKTNFSNIRVSVPPKIVQEQIAGVLSAYDNLIENNTRRIKLLEQMAELIYREWFVNFRFPGHEDVEMVDSELGPVPKGWEMTTLASHIEVDKGLSYKGSGLSDSGTPMLSLKCFSPSGGFRAEGIKGYSEAYKPRHRVAPGDIIIANTDLTQAGTVIGSPAIVPKIHCTEDIIITHHLFAVRPKSNAQLPTHFLYLLLKSEKYKGHARGRASGTTVLGLRADDALDFHFAKPPHELLQQYEQFAKPQYRLAEALERKNDILRQTRDMLLPKLISGELDVSELNAKTITEAVIA